MAKQRPTVRERVAQRRALRDEARRRRDGERSRDRDDAYFEPPHVREQRRKRRRGLVLGALGLAIFAIVAAASYYLRPLPYDEATLCPYGEQPHRSFVVIDRSDNVIGPERLRRLIIDEARDLPMHGRLTIYEIADDPETITDALFDFCNPGRGDQVSPLYRNPRRVEERYQSQFSAPLDRLLARLSTPMSAARSPLVEALAEVMRVGARERQAVAPRTRILIASDFLQNSPAYGNHYDANEALRIEEAGLTLLRAHGTTSVEIQAVVMQRNQFLTRQERAIEEFWKPVVASAGIETVWK